MSLPRKGSTMYGIMRGNKEEQKNTISKFKFWNKWFVIPLYKANILPLFGAGKIFVLLETIGRKSGIKRYTPVEYRKYEDSYLLFASRGNRSDWFRNIKANPDKVVIKNGFKKFHPKIEIVDNADEKLRIMKWYVEKFPGAAKMLFGWDKKNDIADIETFGDIVNFIQIVKITK